MTSRNPDALANQMPSGGSGEFHPRVQPDEPLTTRGHKPGVLVGNDAVPEFKAQTLPPGSAPSDRTFQPNPVSEIPPVNKYSDDNDPDAPNPPPNDMPGATSADVHTGLGHPGQGQTSAELRHDGQKHRKNPGTGGYDGLKSGQPQHGLVDEHDPEHAGQRGLERDDAQLRNAFGGTPAEEKVPEGPDTVASEHKERTHGDKEAHKKHFG